MNRGQRRRMLRGAAKVSPASELIARESPEVILPLMNAFDILAAECESELSEDFVMAQELTAREILSSERFREKLVALVEAQALGILRSQHFQDVIKSMIVEHVSEIAVDILAERIPEAEARVRGLIEKEWDDRVTKVAHELLEQKLQAVRQAFAK
jgi:hypothetical protein